MSRKPRDSKPADPKETDDEQRALDNFRRLETGYFEQANAFLASADDQDLMDTQKPR